MSKEHLGVGAAFPLAYTADGGLALAADGESVRQSILLILKTAKGERVMRPDFGCGIYDLVFELNNATTAGKVSQAVQEALILFEPRIDLLDVRVTSGGDREVLLISIDYRLRSTNDVFNLVYPFYLEGSAR
jgi:phage baseplate assembly protein W